MGGNPADRLEPTDDTRDAIPLVSYYEHERHRRGIICNVVVFLAFCMAVATTGVVVLAYWQHG